MGILIMNLNLKMKTCLGIILLLPLQHRLQRSSGMGLTDRYRLPKQGLRLSTPTQLMHLSNVFQVKWCETIHVSAGTAIDLTLPLFK